jgi:hypothetical protein
VRAIGAWQQRVARQRSIRAPRTGAITFVQVCHEAKEELMTYS